MWLGQTQSETRMLKLKSLWYRDKVVKQSRTQNHPPPSCEEEDVLKLNVQFSLYPILNSSPASTPPCHNNNQLKIISLDQSVSESLCFLIESKNLSLWLAGGEKMWMWVIGADIVHLAAAVYYPMWGPGPILILGQIHKFSRKSRKSQSRKYLKTSKGELFLLFSSSKLCQPSHSSR